LGFISGKNRAMIRARFLLSLRANKFMKILFLDESGDHNLEIIDRQYPIFVLVGVIFDYDYYNKTAKDKIKKFKLRLFDSNKIILHTADIYRNKKGFESIKNPNFRKKFYENLNSLIETLKFEIVAAAIHKKKHLSKYGISALDPYLLSLEFVIERFIFSLDDDNKQGIVVAESRGKLLDNQLELAWLNLKIKGTRFLEPSRLAERIKNFKIIPKSKAIGGLEVADLVASPLGRRLMGKPTKENFKSIYKKFRRDGSNRVRGHGLIVFPK
jgi:hypothetical protein